MSEHNKKSYIVGTFITVFWLFMMASLFYDRILPQKRIAAGPASAMALDSLTKNWQDSEEHMLLLLNGKPIGASGTVVRRISDPATGVTYRADFRLGAGLSVLKLKRNLKAKGAGELDSNFLLDRFHFETDLVVTRLALTGRALGNMLLLDITRDGHKKLARVDLGKRISLLDAVRPVATRNFEIKPGNSVTLPVVDPMMSIQHGEVTLTVKNEEQITVGRKSVSAFPVETALNDFKSTTWVDAEGRTLKRQLIGGLTMERTNPGQAIAKAEVLKEELLIPVLNPEDFTTVPLQTLEQLSDQKQSPLAILGSLSL